MTLDPWANWLTESLEKLYQPLSEDSGFSSRFYRTFSPDAVISVNHENISVSALESRIKDEVVVSNQVSGLRFDWKETFDVPQSEGGIVAGLYVVTRTLKFRIRAGPAEILGYRSFSAKVVKDENAQPGEDHWRVSEFFLTERDKPAPIHFPVPRQSVQ